MIGAKLLLSTRRIQPKHVGGVVGFIVPSEVLRPSSATNAILFLTATPMGQEIFY
jgi:hypothetical protein